MINTLKCPICGRKLKPVLNGWQFICGHERELKEFGKPIFNNIETKDSFFTKITKFNV